MSVTFQVKALFVRSFAFVCSSLPCLATQEQAGDTPLLGKFYQSNPGSWHQARRSPELTSMRATPPPGRIFHSKMESRSLQKFVWCLRSLCAHTPQRFKINYYCRASPSMHTQPDSIRILVVMMSWIWVHLFHLSFQVSTPPTRKHPALTRGGGPRALAAPLHPQPEHALSTPQHAVASICIFFCVLHTKHPLVSKSISR